MLGEGCCCGGAAAAAPKKELDGMGEGPLGDGAGDGVAAPPAAAPGGAPLRPPMSSSCASLPPPPLPEEKSSPAGVTSPPPETTPFAAPKSEGPDLKDVYKLEGFLDHCTVCIQDKFSV